MHFIPSCFSLEGEPWLCASKLSVCLNFHWYLAPISSSPLSVEPILPASIYVSIAFSAVLLDIQFQSVAFVFMWLESSHLQLSILLATVVNRLATSLWLMSLTSFHVHLHSLWPVRHSHSKSHHLDRVRLNINFMASHSKQQRPNIYYVFSEHVYTYTWRDDSSMLRCTYTCTLYNPQRLVYMYYDIWLYIYVAYSGLCYGVTISICVDAALWGMAVFSHMVS